jgi:hypothetical protein
MEIYVSGHFQTLLAGAGEQKRNNSYESQSTQLIQQRQEKKTMTNEGYVSSSPNLACAMRKPQLDTFRKQDLGSMLTFSASLAELGSAVPLESG